MSEEGVDNAEFRFQTVGEQLKSARESRGLTLGDIATQTRVPMRHLEAIEAANYSALPGSTYTVGFTKAYVRALKLDEQALIAELRTELAQGGHDAPVQKLQSYEPADPARVPPRWLAWGAAGFAVVLIAGYFLWRSMALAPDAAAPTPVAETETTEATAKKPAAAPASADGQVVLTAKDTVWIRVYDADNKRLHESEMKVGDRYEVPRDANNPMIVTGRPQSLDVTIGGKAVAPLGEPDRTIADVGISAGALLARSPADTATPSAPSSTTPQ